MVHAPKGFVLEPGLFVGDDSQNRRAFLQGPPAVDKEAFQGIAAFPSPAGQLAVGKVRDDDVYILDRKGAEVGDIPLPTGKGDASSAQTVPQALQAFQGGPVGVLAEGRGVAFQLPPPPLQSLGGKQGEVLLRYLQNQGVQVGGDEMSHLPWKEKADGGEQKRTTAAGIVDAQRPIYPLLS